MNNVIYLSSEHILKNIIKKSKAVDVDEKVRKAFVFLLCIVAKFCGHERIQFYSL